MAVSKKRISEMPKIPNNRLKDFIVPGVDRVTNENGHADMLQLKGNTAYQEWAEKNPDKTYEDWLAFIKGDKGNSIELQKTATHIQWREVGTTTWTNLIPVADLIGATGASIELQVSATHIQWRVKGDTAWLDLIAIADLKGETGSIDNIDTVTVAFTESAERDNVATGETFAILFGKIAKWFTDFKGLAFKDKIDYDNDIENAPTIPAKVSELTNDSKFITNTVNNLANYYLKTETYTRTEVQALIDAIQRVRIESVDKLPESGESNVIYLVPVAGSTGNIKEEYIWIGDWELIGSTEVDLSAYAKTADVDSMLEELAGGFANYVNEKLIENKVANIANDTDDNTLYITDENGNVIAKIDDSGIDAPNIRLLHTIIDKLNLTSEQIEVLSEISKIISPIYDNAYYITDSAGNIIFQATDEGVKFVSSDKKTWMEGLNMYSLCDSLGTAGTWQEKIAELTGMLFDKNINYNGDNNNSFSVGGSQTASHPNGGFDRAKRLVEYAQTHPVDVLFLENINDSTWVDLGKTKEDIDDLIKTEIPYFEDQYLHISTGQENFADAINYFKTNITTILADITPKKNTNLYLDYARLGKNVKITSTATSNGNITLEVGGNSYNVAITTSMTITDIVQKIIEIDYVFPSYTATIGSDNISVDFMPVTSEETANVIFTANNTGITTIISDIQGLTSSYQWSYKSLDLSQSAWIDSSNWGDKWNTTLVAIMKGLLEYLCTNLPYTKIYWFIPTRFGVASSTIPKRADGSYDIDVFKANDLRYELCVYTQKKVCEYYSIPVIDLYADSGINIMNALNYYNENNVHPLELTYNLWGEKAIRFLI